MTIPILPKLKPDDAVLELPTESGQWKAYKKAVFEDIAKSLDYTAPGSNKKINSVPNIWALPMTLEIPLLNNRHPMHSEAVAQWQGMLGTIAFAKTRNIQLKVQRLDINDVRSRHSFAEALWQLKPDSSKSLYTIDGKEPWQEIFIWTLNGQPVGMTSPVTIVVPAPEADWGDLPWWDREERKLTNPLRHLSNEEKPLFGGWLKNLAQEVDNKKYGGNSQTRDTIGGLLTNFQAEMGVNLAASGDIFDRDSPQYFGVPVNRGVLIGLNQPIKLKEIGSGDSFVKVIGSKSKTPTKPMLLIDPDIANVWGIEPQNIRVHKDKTLVSFNSEDLKTWDDVKCVEKKDIFLEKLTFIDVEDALPGAYPINANPPLLFDNNKITPLLPFKPILLEYFTPEELMPRVRFRQNGQVVTVSLNLPLAGMNASSDSPPTEYQLVKEYTLDEQNAIEDVPVLDLWPHIQVPGWQNYYAFYYGDERNTFNISFKEAQEPHTYNDANGDYIITRLDSFPNYINCQRQGYPIGLILLRTPIEQKGDSSWLVGVDFGTSFTNVYVNRNGNIESLKLESLHLKVTDANVETRQPLLFKNFIPEIFLPTDKPLPLATVLTRLGETGNDQKKVLYDGRIFVPNRNDFHPEDNWIEPNLKWKDGAGLSALFLEHLGLIVSALAAKTGVKKIQWAISYPSAFSTTDTGVYADTWRKVTDALRLSTGMTHIAPDEDKFFRTESLALAQYFADKEGCDLIRSACIDLGGGTSDISIWQNNNLIHQCSIQLAGRDLLSQFLRQRPNLIIKWFKQKDDEWLNLKDDDFNSKLDSLLRHESEVWLKNERLKLSEDRDFQGLVQLMAIGTAGIYYYVGLILNTLAAEEKYTEREIPSVYIGGNGCRLLHWLDNCGNFTKRSGINDLFKQMVMDASNLQDDSSSDTQISKRPKDEAACGLVLDKSKLKGLGTRQKDPLIAGENCRINGQDINFDQRMTVPGKITTIEAPPQLDRLIDFIDSFNKGILNLEIEEEIQPFSQYNHPGGLEPEYANKLFSKTNRELKSMLLNINNGDGDKLRLEPPFILGLKALMRVLAKEWADK